MLVLFLCGLASAKEPDLSKKVVPVRSGWGPRPAKVGAEPALSRMILVYDVVKVDGTMLYLVDEWKTVSGWARRDEVVSIIDAIRYFSEKLTTDQRNAFYLVMRAKVYRYLKRLDEAEADLGYAHALAPRSTAVKIQQSELLRARKKADRAVAVLEEARLIDESDPLILYNLGWARFDAGDLKGSVSDFDMAIRLDPSYGVAYYSRGCGWMKLKDYDKAVTDLTRSIELKLCLSRAYNARGLCFAEKKRYNLALSDFSAALALDPGDTYSLNARGAMFQKLGDSTRALADLNEAIRLDPRHSLAYANRSRVWYDTEQWDQAIADATAALDIDRGCALAYYNRAIAREEVGEATEARRDMEQARKLAPGVFPD